MKVRFRDTTVSVDCTDERHSNFENSDVDLNNQDPTYKVLSEKQRQIPVYPSRSILFGSSSASTSSAPIQTLVMNNL